MVANDGVVGLREYDGLESLTENEMLEDSNEEDDSFEDTNRRSDFSPDDQKLIRPQKIVDDTESDGRKFKASR